MLVAVAFGGGTQRVVYAAAKEAGVTKMRTTKHYLIVLNVVPPEHMYPPAVAARIHPTDGELNIRGSMAPITPTARHFEAHIYSRRTGLPIHGGSSEMSSRQRVAPVPYAGDPVEAGRHDRCV